MQGHAYINRKTVGEPFYKIKNLNGFFLKQIAGSLGCLFPCSLLQKGWWLTLAWTSFCADICSLEYTPDEITAGRCCNRHNPTLCCHLSQKIFCPIRVRKDWNKYGFYELSNAIALPALKNWEEEEEEDGQKQQGPRTLCLGSQKF